MQLRDLKPSCPAQRGAFFLDCYGPADWRERLKPSELDMNDTTRCVLGQLYGSYSDGADRFKRYDRNRLYVLFGFISTVFPRYSGKANWSLARSRKPLGWFDRMRFRLLYWPYIHGWKVYYAEYEV